jgi:hypothetical protein
MVIFHSFLYIPNRPQNGIQSNGDVDLKFEGEYDRVGLQLVGGQMI